MPKGLSTISYGIVQDDDDGAGDLRVHEGEAAVTVTGQGGRETLTTNFDHVYESGVDNEVLDDIFGHTQTNEVNKPLEALVDSGFSVVVLLIGSKATQRRTAFQGKGKGDYGLIGWTCERVFEKLNLKANSLGRNAFEFTAEVSMVEIYDEVMTDLIQPSNTAVEVQLDPHIGYTIAGSERRQVAGVEDVQMCIDYARENCNTHAFPTGNAADSRSAVFELLVKQVMKDDQDEWPMTVRLLVVDVPPTDKLAEEEEMLRAQQGTTLHRSLLSFRSVCKALSRKHDMWNAPFGQSKLTAVLQDLLGADSVVVNLTFLNSGEPDVSLATLDLVERLNSCTHFPIEKSEGSFVQGLLESYRARLLALVNQTQLSQAGAEESSTEVADLLGRTRVLERELIETRIECNTAKDDGVKVFKLLELFKAKYNQLVDDKADQAKQLIGAEEAKLQAGSALLELRLEHGRVQQQQEDENFKLESELLRAKTLVTDLEMKLSEAKQEAENKALAADEASRNNRESSGELTVARKRLVDLKQQFDREVAAHSETGAQLISLVNKNNILLTENTDLKVLSGSQKEQLEKLTQERAQMDSSLREKSGAYEDMRNEKLKLEIEKQHASVHYEQDKLDNQKGSHEELLHLRTQVDELSRASQALQASLRKETRRAERLERDMAQKEGDYLVSESKQKVLEEQFALEQEKYRVKLLNVLAPTNPDQNTVADAISSAKKKKKKKHHADLAEEQMKSDAARRELVDELLSTYRANEKAMQEERDSLVVERRQLVSQNRLLYRKICDLCDYLDENNTPKEVLPTKKDMDALQATPEEATAAVELDKLRQLLDQAERRAATHQENALQVAETFRTELGTLQDMQRDLSHQIDILENEKAQLLQRLENSQSEAMLDKIEQMKQELVKQLALNENVVSTKQNSLSSTDRLELESLRRENAQLQATGTLAKASNETNDLLAAENQRLKQDLGTLRHENDLARRSSTSSAQASSKLLESEAKYAKLKSENKGLRTMVAELQTSVTAASKAPAADGGDVSDQLADAEARCAALMAKCASLEEEIKQYREYMKKTVARYKKTISELQKKG